MDFSSISFISPLFRLQQEVEILLQNGHLEAKEADRIKKPQAECAPGEVPIRNEARRQSVFNGDLHGFAMINDSSIF